MKKSLVSLLLSTSLLFSSSIGCDGRKSSTSKVKIDVHSQFVAEEYEFSTYPVDNVREDNKGYIITYLDENGEIMYGSYPFSGRYGAGARDQIIPIPDISGEEDEEREKFPHIEYLDGKHVKLLKDLKVGSRGYVDEIKYTCSITRQGREYTIPCVYAVIHIPTFQVPLSEVRY